MKSKYHCIVWKCKLKDGRKCGIVDIDCEYTTLSIRYKFCLDTGIGEHEIDEITCEHYYGFEAQMYAEQQVRFDKKMSFEDKLAFCKKWGL